MDKHTNGLHGKQNVEIKIISLTYYFREQFDHISSTRQQMLTNCSQWCFYIQCSAYASLTYYQ